ncbi:MAG: alpha-hydroxy-acid oxidizing protein [Candidatus Tectomicrobia bacterium]|uniref:Alpha-hydroxy-acid oxidizing protein n=1 Tax=Tectimicrobiota bacterium TaxID=2528274 RepID=A0A933GMA3_UNCTE|nr:alpha-hydroxy-acid oxidizing protein [Candidatus Tectomicrobia bacterium]
MRYGELIQKAEEALEAKGVLKNYRGLGAETGYTGRFNFEYFKAFGFKLRMIDSVLADTEITLFNRRFKTPITSGALSGMTNVTDNPLSKLATGVKEAGSMMWVGITTSDQFLSVIKTGVPTVRIVKPYADMQKMISEIKEAEEAGAIAVGTDVDFFYGGKVGDHTFAPGAMGPKSTDQLKELVAITKLPFIHKGILSASDAEKAMKIGAGAIVVSNHAGAVIDYCAHPLEVLPEIKSVIGNSMPIFVDSGFRRGADVMKALALGADAVCMGNALIMGLAANESQGVTEIINILNEEIRRIMSVTGCTNLKDIKADILVKRSFII